MAVIALTSDAIKTLSTAGARIFCSTHVLLLCRPEGMLISGAGKKPAKEVARTPAQSAGLGHTDCDFISPTRMIQPNLHAYNRA
jgi:hypothetical protein